MKLLLPVVATAIAVSGCTNLGSLNKYQPYPQAQLPEKSYQDKFQAAAHWNALAKNEASLMAKSISPGANVAISPAASGTSFGKAYGKMLGQHLIANGVILNAPDSGATYQISYETQVVRHRDRDGEKPAAGTFSAVAGSAWLIAQAADNWGTPGLVAVPFALAGDIYLANNRDAETPNTEVLVTTNVLRGSQIVQTSTRIYYFNSGDSALYASSASDKRTMTITDQP